MREIKDKLEGELHALEHEFRVEIPKDIKTAVAMGDLRENAEYKAALERQAFVRARIGQLRERLTSLNSVNLGSIPKTKIGLGTTVKLFDLDNDAEVTYELVFPEMADVEKGLLSIASPIGRGLMGHGVSDEIEVNIPSGIRTFEVLELQTVHDKSQS